METEDWSHLPRSAKEARDAGSKRYFTGKPCKHGHVAARWAANGDCVECARAYQRVYSKTPAQRERERAYRSTPAYREWDRAYSSTPAYREHFRAYSKTPARREYYRAWDSHSRALKLKASPPWLNAEHKEAIRAIYAEAARLTEATGIEHQVDHVVPLKAKDRAGMRIASGLHVPWNLQILTAFENQSKNCYLEEAA